MASFDFQRPLLPQVWAGRWATRDYIALVESGGGEGRKGLRSAHILPAGLDWVVRTTVLGHLWLLVALVAAAWLGGPVQWRSLAVGFAWWPLWEYAIHRYLLHELVPLIPDGCAALHCAHFVVHGYHHMFPSDVTHLMWPPAPVLGIAYSVYRVLALGVSPEAAWSKTLGLFLGNFLYDYVHYLCHTNARAPLLSHLRRLHLRHHFVKPSGPPYGVLHPWVDVVVAGASNPVLLLR